MSKDSLTEGLVCGRLILILTSGGLSVAFRVASGVPDPSMLMWQIYAERETNTTKGRRGRDDDYTRYWALAFICLLFFRCYV